MKNLCEADCLPADLRDASTTITRIAAGLSGAGVHRVETANGIFVLKISGADQPLDEWRRRVEIQWLAAEAGVTPRVVHTDDARRAVVTAFVADRSFMAVYGNPQTRPAALAQLGETVRRLHALPIPAGTPASDPQALLARIRETRLAGFALPAFADDAMRRLLAEAAPADGRAPVLSHNDVNPTNLIHDGEQLLLLDWDTAGANDPLYDLATISIFLRMDETSCRQLLAAYDAEPVAALPERFAWNRRMAAILAGAASLHLARQGGHPGASGTETFESTPSLGDFYQRMRAGGVDLRTADGQWAFGLALVRKGYGPGSVS